MTVRYSPQDLELMIADDGPSRTDDSSPGYRLIGMREGVSVYDRHCGRRRGRLGGGRWGGGGGGRRGCHVGMAAVVCDVGDPIVVLGAIGGEVGLGVPVGLSAVASAWLADPQAPLA